MALRVLPDGSVAIRTDGVTVHIDAQVRALHLRTGTARDVLGGIILASYDFDAVKGVRLKRDTGRWEGQVLLKRAGTMKLGRWMAWAEAETTVSQVASLMSVPSEIEEPETHRGLWVGQEVVTPVGPISQPFGPPLEVSEAEVIDVSASVDVLSLVWRGDGPTRYFAAAPSRLVRMDAWGGVRQATGAFVRALSRSVLPQTDAPWPQLLVSPPTHYFASAPGSLVAPARRPPSAERRADVEEDLWSGPDDALLDELPLLEDPSAFVELSTLDEDLHLTPPPRPPPPVSSEEQLRAAVGKWREPTPPPRFPPTTVPTHDLQLDLPPIRRQAEFDTNEVAADGPPPEADWALAYYQTVSVVEPRAAPDLPMVRSIGSDTDDEPDVTPLPKLARASSRPSIVPVAPSAPPAILEIPGFNDGPGVGLTASLSSPSPPADRPQRPSIQPAPAPMPTHAPGGARFDAGSLIFQQLLIDTEVTAEAPEDPPRLDGPPASLQRQRDGAKLELVRLAAEDLPIASVGLAR